LSNAKSPDFSIALRRYAPSDPSIAAQTWS
jgi:hypothetical protein